MRKRIEFRLSVIVVYDASKPAVSWLKIEPSVSILLVIKSAVQFLSLVLLWKILLFGHVFMGVS